ncbi:MAG: hypothetical protein OHK0046_15520 [Anaerolineae bacterium]
MTEQPNNPQEERKTFTEELEVAGNQLVDRVQDIIKQGNVRRLVIRSADDRVLLETSLTVGAVAGSVLVLASLPLAILATIAAAVTRVKVEIVREIGENDVIEGKSKVEIAVDEE